MADVTRRRGSIQVAIDDTGHYMLPSPSRQLSGPMPTQLDSSIITLAELQVSFLGAVMLLTLCVTL